MVEKVLERSEGRIRIVCGFCEGQGIDPFGVMSSRSKCQVCSGRGTVTVREPARECAFCAGSGIHQDQRIPCIVCRGKGMVTVKEGAEECPHCQGIGMAPSETLPCKVCGGKGVVVVK